MPLDLAIGKELQRYHFFIMSANPKSIPRVLPVVPKRAPATQLSIAHLVSSVSGGPSAVMLQPLHQTHGEAAVLSQPIAYNVPSYVQETTENEAGQIEAPEQYLIDPAFTAEKNSTDKAQKPDNIHSVFDVTDKDVKAFIPAENSWKDDESELHGQHARNYKKCIKILCFLSCLSCMWPVTGLCLCIANFTSNKTIKRNDEQDYDSANGCRKVTKVFIILVLIFLVISPIIIVAASVGVELHDIFNKQPQNDLIVMPMPSPTPMAYRYPYTMDERL